MKKEYKKSKVIYYTDELNDDFDEIDGVKKRPPLKNNYNYQRKGIIRFFDFLLYYFIAKPILGFYCLFHGIKVKNKGYLRLLKRKGAFFYSNHVAISDVFKFQSLIIFSKKVNIIGYSDASQIPIAKFLVKSLGYMPIPDNANNLLHFKEIIAENILKRKEYILIYPEAHIWPYYTKIRPFKSVSFYYPAMLNAPIVPITTTWRKVWYSKKPRQTIIFSKPIYPKEELGVNENKEYLRDECYQEMMRVSLKFPQYEYIKYIKKDENEK